MYGITAGAVCHWSLKSQFLENVLFLITTLTIMNKFPYKFLMQMISTKLSIFVSISPFHTEFPVTKKRKLDNNFVSKVR